MEEMNPSQCGVEEINNSNDERERKVFMQDLNKFMSDSGKPLSKIPIMGYKELDLYQLFKEVMLFGGFNEVVKNVGTWSKIWKRLANFDPSITDSSFRLKKNYERYLLEYEYKVRPEHRQHASSLEIEKQLKRSSAMKEHSPSPTMTRHSSTTELNNLSPSLTNSISNLLNPSLNCQKKDKLSSSLPSTPATLTRVSSNPNLLRVGELTQSLPDSPSSPLSYSDDQFPSFRSRRQYKKKLETVLKPVPRDTDGSPVLPLDFGDFVLESLGSILPRSPFVTDKHVWPVGYRITRMFRSMNTPEISVKYACSIVDGGEKPLFVILAEDESKSIQSHSPSGAWKIVFSRLCEKTGEEMPPRKTINGVGRFGLQNPHVVHLIKELSDSERAPSSFSFNNSPTLSLGSPSPLLRKRKSSVDLASNEDSFTLTTNSSAEEGLLKFPRVEKLHNSNEEIVFHTKEELDDLETAVETLNALKFCSVY